VSTPLDLVSQSLGLKLNQADQPVLTFLGDLLRPCSVQNNTLLILIYTEEYLYGLALAQRLHHFISNPVQVTANMFQLDELIESYPRVVLISRKIRLRSTEMKHELHYYNIDKFSDSTYFLRFIDDVNGLLKIGSNILE
ncbi:MAG: hypothetical protein ABF915_14095, partial [Schleiferilactobacillus harbinensis]